CQQYSRFLTF
nr:immunoglobulin light chain junction region [Homo sapiens]MCH00946.1 immunoglobulin light chain junction region [Homo sapiens]